MSLILIKRLLILLITLLEVLGLILIAYGVFVLYTAKPAEHFPGGFLIILGSITMIMAIFGFLAAFRESPVSLMIYFGVLALMIRLNVVFIDLATGLVNGIKEKIRESSAFKPLFGLDPEEISELEIMMQWLRVIIIVCWLIILVEVVGAVFTVLLYGSIKTSRLAENPIP